MRAFPLPPIFIALATLVLPVSLSFSQTSGPQVIEIERTVETSPPPNNVWSPAELKRPLVKKAAVAARDLSRAVVRLSESRLMRVAPNTSLTILPSLLAGGAPGLDVGKGEVYLFSRGSSSEMSITTPVVEGRPHGTQFRVLVEDDGTTTFTMFEGEVELVNGLGKLTLGSKEEGIVEPGKAPRKTARIDAKNTIQWCLYYPGVIHVPELGLTKVDASDLRASLAAYASGDLLGSLANWPANYHPRSAQAQVYHAMVLLAVGEVEGARSALSSVPANVSGRRAIEEMMDAVNFEKRDGEQEPGTASGWLARSYYEQSRATAEPKEPHLEQALTAARKSLELAPDFGYAAVRVAELEFSFGRTKAGMKELARGLQLTPRNAQAYSLQGFMYSDWNCIAAARASFEIAIELDSALGTAWLGRGLCDIRSGRVEAGLGDLQTATILEPNRSLFHSYLGKAASQFGNNKPAMEDLDFAKKIDPADPTPWLYSALVLQEQYKPNKAIHDLQKSIELNDNRRLYRSSMLLDQDRAVRGANLAKIYQYNGMREVAVREATRAVESDYTNPSAHLFLANSFDALRDPDRILLRNETPWFNELLLSNMLSPVGGGPLSQFVSQEEYSKLLESDGIGGSFVNQWRGNSDIRSTASVFGTEGKVSYGLDAYYQNDTGDRPNSEMRLQELYGQFKWQPSPDDIFYFLGKWAAQKGGDNTQNYDNTTSPYATHSSFEENQEPGLLLAGWNHRWAPGSNTLFLAGRLNFEQTQKSPLSQQLLVERDNDEMLDSGFLVKKTLPFGVEVEDYANDKFDGSITSKPGGFVKYSDALLKEMKNHLGKGTVGRVYSRDFNFDAHREFDVYSGEIQQIEQTDCNTLLLGGRWQQGKIEADENLKYIPALDGGFSNPASKQHLESDFRRTGLYAYDYWNVLPQLTLLGGVAWDTIDHPDNFRNPPVNDRQKFDQDVSGKFGFTWQPTRSVTFRGLAAGGMGGLSFDESVRLEPSQLSGFNQAYRTVLSESVAGSVEAPLYQIYGLSAEGVLPERTWWGASVNFIDQEVSRTRGIFTGYVMPGAPLSPTFFADSTREDLDYQEGSFALTLNRLLGDEFAVGAGYRVTMSELQTRLPELPVARATDEATLQEFGLHGDWNSPTGWFAHVEANAYIQRFGEDNTYDGLRATVNTDNRHGNDLPERNGDDFIQFNAWAGYRFYRNLCEVSAGVLNIGGTDYQLSPLNPYADIARERTFFMFCRMSF
ncbi:MAG: FecR domain-containing protein [Luteolibacter sp.]|uniref:FecR domain-containing protein n=1 Tax=Luteolibacter sp. TaxID=1962973 RepID=UPI003267BA89